MTNRLQNFSRLREAGFDYDATFHADAILHQKFGEAVTEIEECVLSVVIPIGEIIRGGGGETPGTQRLRKCFAGLGWSKETFRVEKVINERTTSAMTHEIDHVKQFENGAIALEIEWNNKDPFYDRDLENFNRLHSDGAISVGVIVTRGSSFQEKIGEKILSEVQYREIASFQDLESQYEITPTPRQRASIERKVARSGTSFAEIWAHAFRLDKFGSATTHWEKLKSRLDRGVGRPCPVIALGIPISVVSTSQVS